MGTSPPPPSDSTITVGSWSISDATLLAFVKTVLIGFGYPESYFGSRIEEFSAKHAHVIKSIPEDVLAVVTVVADIAGQVAKPLVKAITTLLIPISSAFGEASKAYIEQLTASIAGVNPAQSAWSSQALNIGAQGMFDDIVSPLAALTGAFDPSVPANGVVNIQRSLGGIVSLHLMTWVLNVVSNLTGIGVLKFMNSFNEVALAALNARNLSRQGMKPFIDTYMVQPATNALNNKLPLKPLSESLTLKAFIRGALAAPDAQLILRQLGYKEDLQSTFLLDAIKFPDTTMLGKLVNVGWMSQDDARGYLKQQGWPETTVDIVLKFAMHEEVFSILKDAGERLQSHYEQGQIDEATFKSLLQQMMFSDLEIEALLVQGAIAQVKIKRLPESVVRTAHAEGRVDDGYVLNWLTGEGYSDSDSELYFLTEFVPTAERQLKQDLLAARARFISAHLEEAAKIATNRGETEVAIAEQDLALHERELSAFLTGQL